VKQALDSVEGGAQIKELLAQKHTKTTRSWRHATEYKHGEWTESTSQITLDGALSDIASKAKLIEDDHVTLPDRPKER